MLDGSCGSAAAAPVTARGNSLNHYWNTIVAIIFRSAIVLPTSKRSARTSTRSPRCETGCLFLNTLSTMVGYMAQFSLFQSRPCPPPLFRPYSVPISSLVGTRDLLPRTGIRLQRHYAGVAESAATVIDSSEPRDASNTSPPAADTWELDFSSRPLFDERGKKRWELLICDPARTWEYSLYFPNNKINSTEVGRCWGTSSWALYARASSESSLTVVVCCRS